jgi:putative oxidoreductase
MSWADKFNLLDGTVILRLTCALHFIPHVVGKFTEPATLNFFKAAKFNPPATWMYIAGAIETVLTFLLLFDIYTPYVAVVAAFHLSVAGAATYKVTKKWIWVIGGIEYCVFWMLCCIALAMLTWPK